MRELYARAGETIGKVIDAGITVYAGTDAGGGIAHGRIVDEVVALAEAGLGRGRALAAATTAARDWLGRPRIEPGAPADVVVLPEDPRGDLEVLRRPTAVLRRGRRL
jgi:imidazolonepropionase-like amidohydrolase